MIPDLFGITTLCAVRTAVCLAIASFLLTGCGAPAHAFNMMMTPREVAPNIATPFPDGLAAGTRLQGTVTEAEVELVIEGNVTTGDRPFVTTIRATRAN